MYDALTIAAIVDEYQSELLNGRIQQALQIDALTIALEVYVNRGRRWLVMSAHPEHGRIVLTSRRVDGDAERVSPILLLLRKYARGGRVLAVSQPRHERVVRLTIAKRLQADDDDDDCDESEPDFVYSDLHVELMGRRSNIIMTSAEGRILDAVKRVTPEMSRVRPIRPGTPYVSPPPQNKMDPLAATVDSLLVAGSNVTEPLARWLVSRYVAVSPPLGHEIAARAGLDPTLPASQLNPESAKSVRAAMLSVFEPLETGTWEPRLYVWQSGAADFSAITMQSVEREDGVATTAFTSISAAAEAAWDANSTSSASAAGRHTARRERLLAEIDEGRDRIAHRLASLREQQGRAAEAEQWKIIGEAIYASFADIQPGQSEFRTDDGRLISLDPSLSASQNAQEYFERYRKGRSAEENIPAMIEAAERNLAYLDQLRSMTRLSETYDEIEVARHEWLAWTEVTAGAPRAARPKGARPAASARRPRAFRTSRGDIILVGRSGSQNDAVTFDIAGPDDLWLHARNMPGAHVVVRANGTTLDETVEAAAALAAWHSEGRNSTTVPVDVTQRRYVRKIKGAGPGMVTYRNERTISARPRSEQDLGLVTTGRESDPG